MLENSENILRTFIEVQMNNLLAGYGNIMRLTKTKGNRCLSFLYSFSKYTHLHAVVKIKSIVFDRK